MSQYDYRELKLQLPKETAEVVKRLAKEAKCSEQQFVIRCIERQLSPAVTTEATV